MKTILDIIVADRRLAVEALKKSNPIGAVVAGIDPSRMANSLKKALTDNGASGIIAEFKRQSPSKGIINEKVTPEEWDVYKQELKTSYERVLAGLRAVPDWDNEDIIGGAMAVMVHTAYHLGEIRQALCVLS